MRCRSIVIACLAFLVACGGSSGGREVPIVFPDTGVPGDPGGTGDDGDPGVDARADARDTVDPGAVDPGDDPATPDADDPGPADVPDDPGPSDPGPVDPGTTDPGPIDPGPVDPGPADPGPPDPGPVDPGPQDAGCSEAQPCPPGSTCVGHDCFPCDLDLRCGPECLPCEAPTPHCVKGACVACLDDAECGAGAWCDDAGTCRPCADDDPLHCGATCEPCVGERPGCVAGQCVCSIDSCGTGRRCLAGACARCDVDEACGAACTPCADPLPHCLAGSTCAACGTDAHCGDGRRCLDGTCVPACYVPGTCETNLAPDGLKCANAKVIGRNEAFAFLIQGDTTDAPDNDDQPAGSCWDANSDNFYRVYLRAGEQIHAVLTPKDATFDSSFKLYRGTGCKKGGDPLVGCWDQGGDAEADEIPAGTTATAEGWYSIVVDGRSAFTEEGDWGAYVLSVSVTCSQPDCCCP